MINNQNIIVFILVLCYTIVGLDFSGSQGFWHDEIYTLTFLKGISAYTFEGNTLANFTQAFPVHYCKSMLQNDYFFSNFHLQILHEGHPPLYFIFLKLWAIVFGYTEVALRSFSLASGILSILVFTSVLKKHYNDNFVFWIILLLILFNPFLFYYFTEARMYAFAFLFAVLSFKYWLRYKDHKNLRSLDFLYFLIASVALLYTHYYGIFFFLCLGFYDVIKNGFSVKNISYSIPLIIFSPWIFVIKLQTDFHKIHWTDGSFSLLNSLIGFGNGLVSLFFSPMTNARGYETQVAIILGVVLVFFVSKNWKNRLLFTSIGIIYFLQIFIFDKLLNHHTIIVSRYYLFILIFFYWAIKKVIDNAPKIISVAFVFAYLISAGAAFYQIYTLSLAPKQMFRELSGYIDSKHDPQNTVIVVEPGGAIIWGLSYYLKNNYNIISAEDFNSSNDYKTIIYVDEMLGDIYWENKLNSEQQKKLNRVPFVGLVLYE